MLYFITGKPGNGKTLYVLSTVHKLAKESGRTVFYDGIQLTEKGAATLGWHQVDGLDKAKKLDDGRVRMWPHIPDGSIVVVDECQRYWRVRAQGSEVPLVVQGIEQHRHFGLDIYFLTQDPKLVDINVRKLVWEHTHIKRIFGSESATLFKWKQRVASVDSKHDYSDALEQKWLYPKENYSWYVSAEAHTVGKQLPWRQMAIIAAIALGVAAAIWWIVNSFGSSDDPAKLLPVSTQMQTTSPASKRDKVTDRWSASAQTPRLDFLPESAPMYDQVTRVRSAPGVAGCMKHVYSDGTVNCTCTTWQGTKINMSSYRCIDIIKDGYFDPSKAYVDPKQANVEYLNRRDAGSGGMQNAAAVQQRGASTVDAGS